MAVAVTAMRASSLRAWWEMVRPFSFPGSVVPVAVGSAIAWAGGRAEAAALPLVLLGLVLTQSGTNVVNEVVDVDRGVDTPTAIRPSRVLIEGRLSGASARRGGVLLLALGAAVGGVLALAFRLGPLPALFGLAGALIGYSYTGAPLHLKYRALGLPAVALALGPLAVLGAQYVQARALTAGALLASLPVGSLVAAILLANDIRDLAGDRAAGIRTGATVLGRQRAWRLYVGLLLFAYAVVAGGVATHLLPRPALLAFLSAPLAWGAVASVGRAPSQRAAEHALARLDVRSAGLHLVFGLLLATGLGLPALGL